ncbi:MAG: radical SAM protein [Peptococcaceae bacterium]|nr:radical SAM protein [Peptococcaceae bacterium]
MEAAYYKRLEDDMVKCQLCTYGCLIAPGEMGRCKCRVNENGTLIAKTYGEISGLTTESLSEMGFHFYPEADLQMLSISGYGCNMNCPYCANAHISQGRIHTEHLSQTSLIERLKNLKRAAGVEGVCYTFNEPLIWFEHVRDYSAVVHEAGYLNAMETNGMIHPDAFKELLPRMDLVNIDYKGYTQEFYRDYLEGDLDNVLENIRTLAESGVYYEVTCVIVAGQNDDAAGFEAGMAQLADVAPEARLNLLAVVARSAEEVDWVPSEEKMNDLLAIAEKYFDEVKIVEREAVPKW